MLLNLKVNFLGKSNLKSGNVLYKNISRYNKLENLVTIN